MRFISDDNKVFNSKEECLEYENVLKKKEESERIRQEKLESDKKKRYQEIVELRKRLDLLENEYRQDYKDELERNINIDPLFYILSAMH